MAELAVLLCAHDAAGTIADAVRSTLAALPRDSELHVLDDASSDGTADVVAAIDDPRIRLSRLTANVGYEAARQRLLEASDSRLVAIMDADDVALAWRFRVQLAELGSADLLVSPVVSFTTVWWRGHPSLPLPVSPAAAPLHLMLGCPFAHPTMLARRESLERLGGYRAYSVAEDYDLYLRLVASGGAMRRGAVPVLGYRRHPGQTSHATSFQERMARAGLVAEARREMLARCLGWTADHEPTPAEQWELVEAGCAARGLGPIDASLVRRHARVALGPRHARADAPASPPVGEAL